MNTREPLVTTATIVSGVTALLALLVAFGIDLSEDQRSAVLGVAAVAAPLLVGLLVRHKVTPTADPRNDNGEPLERRSPFNPNPEETL